jgi:ubiquinone/menaquinone biosynthesis C-methylase UbiE
MLHRKLEPELMDSPDEARDYDAMDHREVNRLFVSDLLAAATPTGDVLDLGTGTAQIPIELCRRTPDCRVWAVDAATHMLDLAQYNVEVAGLIDRIRLDKVDAKSLPFATGQFDTVISNSIVHHIPEPIQVLREAARVTSPGGLLFFRDLMRPADETTLQQLVSTYAGGANEQQREMFADSLHAALSLAEIRELVSQIGFQATDVTATSDRHWTWCGRKPGAPT